MAHNRDLRTVQHAATKDVVDDQCTENLSTTADHQIPADVDKLSNRKFETAKSEIDGKREPCVKQIRPVIAVKRFAGGIAGEGTDEVVAWPAPAAG